MPIARFEMPDGRIGRFEVPDGTTPEQAHSIISSQLSKSPAQIVAGKSTSLVQDLYQGAIKDPIDAAGQIYANGVLGATGQESVRKTLNDDMAKNDPGFSVGRMFGSIGSPVNLLPGYSLKRASDAGKTISALRAGSVSAPTAMVSSPVTEGDFVEGKAIQGAAGFAGGALGKKAGDLAGDALASRAATKDLQQRASQATIYNAMNNALRSEGMPEFNMMPHEVQANLAGVVNQVEAAMRSGQGMDIRALTRQALGDSILGSDARLTLGQSTRDPMQWTREFNLKGIEGAGQPLTSRLQLQNQRLINRIRQGGIEDPYSAGNSAMSGLRRVDEAEANGVNALYAQARDHLGRAAPMDSAAFSNAANDAINAQMLNGALPPQARNILNDITTGQIPFNVNSAVMIDKRLSGMQRDLTAQGNKEGALAVGHVRTALNNAPIADNVGEDAKRVFDQARGAARTRFARHEENPALADVANDAVRSPEQFVRNYVTGSGASVDQVGSLMQLLPADGVESVRNALRYQLLRDAAKGAERGADTAAMSQGALNDALNRIGDRKLQAVFGAEEASRLRNVQYVASLIQKEPFGAVPNRSGTGAMLANLLQSRFMSIPGVNVVRDSVKKSMDEKTVRNALLANIMRTGATPEPANLNRLQSLISVGTVPASGALAVEATK